MKPGFLKYTAVLLLAAFPFLAGAQGDAQPPGKPIVRAAFIPDSIGIGDHVRLRVEVDKDMMQIVGFPELKSDALGPDFHVIAEGPEDTIQGEGRRQTLTKEYLITCFREGIYNIDRVPALYADKNIIDTLLSEKPLFLTVTLPNPIDTVMRTIYDVKPPEKAPLLVSEFSGYLLWIVTAMCFAAAVAWFIYRAASKKGAGREHSSAPRELPHVLAMRELEAMHNLKLWQSGRYKQYYTQLTDIVRTYIEGRYGIGAMEMTSDEIMEAVGEVNLQRKNYGELRSLLYTSDLVKFAKHVPDGDYNEKAWYDACSFVEDTKEVPAEVKASPGEEGAGLQTFEKTDDGQ